MNIREYTIRDRAWETPCGWCGAPIFFGESAFDAPQTEGRPCCSAACAERLTAASNRSIEPPTVAG